MLDAHVVLFFVFYRRKRRKRTVADLRHIKKQHVYAVVYHCITLQSKDTVVPRCCQRREKGGGTNKALATTLTDDC